jgi:pilus assembly protein FimV
MVNGLPNTAEDEHPMMSNNKILTVSYGTFSCTLEGFEDSFGTMKAIAEYFRDLAADDRYFGAEPPQPDAEMLARIAQKEISRRVEAHHRDGRIVLSALEDGRANAAAPAAVASAAVARTPEAPVEDVEEVQQVEAAPAPAEAPATEPAAPVAEAEDTPAEVVTEEPTPAEIVSEAPKAAPEEATDVVADQPDAAVEAFFADSTPAMAEDEDQDQAETGVVSVAAAPAAALPDNSIAAKLQRIRAVVAQQDAAVDYEDDIEAPAARSSEDAAMAEARTDIEDALEADDEADMWRDTAAEDEEDAGEESIDAILQRLESGEAAQTDNPSAPQETADASDEDAAVTETVTEEPNAAPRARVIKVKRADLEAATDGAAFEADEAHQEDEDTGPMRRSSSLSAEQEDELARELAALEADMGAEDPAGPETSDEGSSDLELAELEAGSKNIAADMPQETFVADDTVEEDDLVATPADAAAAEDDVVAEEETFEDDLAAALADELAEEDADIAAALAADEDDEDELPAARADEPAGADADLAAFLAAQDADEAQENAATLAEGSAAAQDDLAAAVSEDSYDDDEDEDHRAESLIDEDNATDEQTLAGDDSIFAEDDVAAKDAADTETPVHRAARTTLLSLDDDLDTSVSRLMAESDHQMHDAEAATRRDAFSHLRAAVAAKKAEHAMGEAQDEDSGDGAYRNDLADVVRPRRPVSTGSRSARPGEQRPAPLKLVAEQRIDIDRSRPASPVRPRRVAAVQEVASTTEGESFAEFAAEMGATKLPQLLEAAAAYMSFVEGREQFSRPQLMSKVRQATSETGFSREDGLRSFGQLLRAGKIEKIKGGRFTVSEEIGFRPDHRAAG